MRASRNLLLGTFTTLAVLSGCSDPGSAALEGAPGAEPSVDTRPPSNLPDDPPTARRATLNELRTAQAAPIHPSDGGGRAWIDEENSDTPARAGQTGRWTLVFEAGEQGIAVGGFLRLTIPRFWDWTPAQTTRPELPGYTVFETAVEGVEIEAQDVAGFWVDFKIKGQPLEDGQQVRITYGAGAAGARADRYAEGSSTFWMSVDGDGDGIGKLLKFSPEVPVLAGPPARLEALVQSTGAPGETLRLHVSVLDKVGNSAGEFRGDVELLSAPEGLDLPKSLTFGPEHLGSRVVEFKAAEAGVYRIAVRTVAEGMQASSNPLLVGTSVQPIRWGDFHGHSNLSDGSGEPEEYLRYARDVSGLDFVALTDHDHWGMQFLDENPRLWRRLGPAVDGFLDEGTFVTILGYEWTSWIHGHRHVLFFDEPGEILSSIDPAYETPAQLWDGLRAAQINALTFAHHSAGGPIATNWDYPPDPDFEPVTEIVSVHGASEAADAPRSIYSPLKGNFVRDALGKGFRLGFIGSGDSHDGHPGLAHIASPSGGLAAVLTDELTREGLLGALLNRRTYATNGPRIILRAALDRYRMGSVLPPKKGTSKLYVRAITCEPVSKIQVIRGANVVGSLDADGFWDVETSFDLEDLEDGEFVYVRVTQADGGAAWSSPFFVEAGAQAEGD